MISFTLIDKAYGLVALLYKELSVIVLNILLLAVSSSHIFNDKLCLTVGKCFALFMNVITTDVCIIIHSPQSTF